MLFASGFVSRLKNDPSSPRSSFCPMKQLRCMHQLCGGAERLGVRVDVGDLNEISAEGSQKLVDQVRLCFFYFLLTFG